MKNVIQLLKLTGPFKGSVILNLIFNVLGMLFSLFSFAMVVPLLKILFTTNQEDFIKIASKHDNISQSTDVMDYANYFMANMVLDNGKYYTLVAICIILIVVVFFKNLFTFLSAVFLNRVIYGVSRSMRKAIYHKILHLQLSFFSDEKKGDLMSRFTSDVREIELSIASSIRGAFKDPFYLIGYILALFYINASLSIFILIFLPISGAVIAFIGNGLKRKSKQGQQQGGILLSVLEETLSGLRIIKAFNAEDKVERSYEEKNNHLYRLFIRIYKRVDVASPISEFLGIVSTSVVLLYGGNMVINGTLEPDLFIGYIILFSQLISPAKSISKAIYESNRGIAALQRINEILEADTTIKDASNAVSIESFNKEIAYENVSFKYENEYVLKNVSFKVENGKTIALVGQSGSGKSTLADLLPRFYDIEEGQITLDGKPIKDITLKSLRDKLGIVTQQSILFNDTVFNNIAFGKPDATIEEVIQAAKIANAHEFIEQLEHAYETNIGDGGGKLSGGQKQRLSIARAVLKNPPILILDEATSALDTESEKLVQDALNKLMQNRTSLVIAHRLSTIQHSDEIIVMQKGEIVERGTHQELIAQNGVYKKLTDMQSFG